MTPELPTLLRRTGAALVLAAALTTGLAACGGDDSSSTAADASAAPTAGGGMDSAQREKISECLQAAGITVPSRQPRPSGTETPSPMAPPTGAPGAGEGGGQGGGQGGGFGGEFSDPTVQAALEACGITVPTGRPAPPAGGENGA